MARPAKSKPADSTANLGFEAKLWLTADKLRNNMDAAEPSGVRQPARQGSPKGQHGGAEQYKHVVLGLIFLKYISDSFDEHHAKLITGEGDFAGANPEDKANTSPPMSSGCRRKPAGPTSRPTPNSPTSARKWTTPCAAARNPWPAAERSAIGNYRIVRFVRSTP